MSSRIVDYSDNTKVFLDEYSKNMKPIQVNFRELTKDFKFQERATHSIHFYPAKLLPNIPFFFLNNSYFVKDNDLVLDPFCGSGTVLLESIISGKNAIGSDSNPLACFISKVKTSKYDLVKLNENLIDLKDKVYSSKKIKIENIKTESINFWFTKSTIENLNTLLFYIESINNIKIKNFFLLCFSNCLKKVSLADQKISVPVRIKEVERLKLIEKIDSKNSYVFDKFFDVVEENIKRFRKKEELVFNNTTSKVIFKDAKKLKSIKSDSVDFIITSPPYAGAQKYIRSSSLSLIWTNLSKLSLKELDSFNIGRENYRKSEYVKLKKTGVKSADILLEEIFLINPLRSHIAANYLIEMRQAISEMVRVLKTDKYVVIVVANNQVCGKLFETQEYLRIIAEQEGLKTVCRLVDDIKSYGLMTKRNKTASIITCEWLLILKKINKSI